MRKLFWAVFLLGSYVWVVTSGHEEVLLNRGKRIYQVLAAWFEDAEVDLHIKEKKIKKRSRRWD